MQYIKCMWTFFFRFKDLHNGINIMVSCENCNGINKVHSCFCTNAAKKIQIVNLIIYYYLIFNNGFMCIHVLLVFFTLSLFCLFVWFVPLLSILLFLSSFILFSLYVLEFPVNVCGKVSHAVFIILFVFICMLV